MASTLTRRNAEISLKALSLGATDYIPKPESNREVAGSSVFRRELIEKVRQLGPRARRQRPAPPPAAGTPAPTVPATPHAPSVVAPPLVPDRAPPAPELRPFPPLPPRALLIGSSTGGPQALTTICGKLGSLFERAPVLITQHMPPTFTTIRAEHIGRVSGRDAHEAKDGEEVLAGRIYVAPGGRHMTVQRRDGVAVIAIDDGPMVNFCKPAVDPLFASAATVWGQWACALVLTGMGSDGLRGAQTLVAAGGCVMAQDEASSVVWGMPGQVTHAGLCSAVLPLTEIAPRLTRLFAGERA
jgi:two-component system chemotaxis response regulator CheB